MVVSRRDDDCGPTFHHLYPGELDRDDGTWFEQSLETREIGMVEDCGGQIRDVFVIPGGSVVDCIPLLEERYKVLYLPHFFGWQSAQYSEDLFGLLLRQHLEFFAPKPPLPPRPG